MCWVERATLTLDCCLSLALSFAVRSRSQPQQKCFGERRTASFPASTSSKKTWWWGFTTTHPRQVEHRIFISCKAYHWLMAPEFLLSRFIVYRCPIFYYFFLSSYSLLIRKSPRSTVSKRLLCHTKNKKKIKSKKLNFVTGFETYNTKFNSGSLNDTWIGLPKFFWHSSLMVFTLFFCLIKHIAFNHFLPS